MWEIPNPHRGSKLTLNCRPRLSIIIFAIILSLEVMKSALWVPPPQKWISTHPPGGQKYGWTTKTSSALVLANKRAVLQRVTLLLLYMFNIAETLPSTAFFRRLC
jgi:hypothetical protein